MASFNTGAHQFEAGIRDEWRACVRNQRNAFAFAKFLDDPLKLGFFIVIMQRPRHRVKPVMLQEPGGVTRILAIDDIGAR